MHRSANDQMDGKSPCLSCSSSANLEDWEQFKALMLKHWGVAIPRAATPTRLVTFGKIRMSDVNNEKKAEKKERKRREALERQAEYNSLTDKQKLDKLNSMAYRASKERGRLGEK